MIDFTAPRSVVRDVRFTNNSSSRRSLLATVSQRRQQPTTLAPPRRRSLLAAFDGTPPADSWVLQTVEKARDNPLLLLFYDQRERQLATLSDTPPPPPDPETERLNKDIEALSLSLGFTIAGGLVFAPLALLSLPGLIYHISGVAKRGYEQLRDERRFGMAAFDGIAFSALLLTGNLFLSACSCLLLCGAAKLQAKTRARSEQRMVDMFANHAPTVWVLREGQEVSVPFERLVVGDVVVVEAGQAVPIDGVVTAGMASIDQRLLTGEAQPVEKGVGDEVFAATLVVQGKVFVQVTRMGAETTAAQIGELLLRTTDFKATLQAKSEVVAERLVGGVTGLSVVASQTVGLQSAIAVLNAPMVDPLRMSAPLNLLSFLQLASQQGVLIKDGKALEILSDVDTVVFDKTGTLTEEQPLVGEIYPLADFDAPTLLRLAAAVEKKQAHPIARAIVQAANAQGLAVPEADDIAYEVGLGIRATVEGQMVQIGSERFVRQCGIDFSADMQAQQAHCNEQGYSLVYLLMNGRLAGAIELRPTIRPESAALIGGLQEQGSKVIIISGDHVEPTGRLARELGVDHYFAETLPEQKALIIEELQAAGHTICFVGDGINDAIALKQANVSVSLRGAATIAMDTADVILMDGNLRQLAYLLELAAGYNSNLSRILVSSLLPGLAVILGAFVFHFGLASTLVAYNISLLTSVSHALRPLLSEKHKR